MFTKSATSNHCKKLNNNKCIERFIHTKCDAPARGNVHGPFKRVLQESVSEGKSMFFKACIKMFCFFLNTKVCPTSALSSVERKCRKNSCASCCLLLENSGWPRPITDLNIRGAMPSCSWKTLKAFSCSGGFHYQNKPLCCLFMGC